MCIAKTTFYNHNKNSTNLKTPTVVRWKELWDMVGWYLTTMTYVSFYWLHRKLRVLNGTSYQNYSHPLDIFCSLRIHYSYPLDIVCSFIFIGVDIQAFPVYVEEWVLNLLWPLCELFSEFTQFLTQIPDRFHWNFRQFYASKKLRITKFSLDLLTQILQNAGMDPGLSKSRCQHIILPIFSRKVYDN